MALNMGSKAVFLACILTVLIFHRAFGTSGRRRFGQLPTTLRPLQYRLSVQPFFPADGITYEPELNLTFRGNVSILIECLEDTDNVTMHMDKIEIQNQTISLMDAEGPWKVLTPLVRYEYETKSHQVSFFFGRSLKAGQKYVLNVTYTGILDAGDLAGFYTSKYEEDGKVKWLAVTHFEPAAARRALPCFDEPFYKAVFYVVITHPSSMVALSNGKEERTEKLENGWSITTFAPSLNMSTYLLAMAVCGFQSKTNYTRDGKTLFRVWARPSFINKTDYAVAVGPKVLDFYTSYFGIPYPLPKQDMLAVPDFSAGAMENWGLITYRENALLYDEKVSSSLNRQTVAKIVAHELAHQWFGDLVTMEWWDDLWLNEGFATYLEKIGQDVISDGAFNTDSQIVSTTLRSALAQDQLDTSHPIFIPVSSVDEISEIFDGISYEKGAAVIRMLNYTLSDEVFRKGLHSYLTKNSFANANHGHLWDAMTEAASETKVKNWNCSKLDVSEFMNPWILQMGYPVLDVQRTYDSWCKSANITQRRFVAQQKSSADITNPAFLNPPYNFTWHVPIWYQTEESTTVQTTWAEANQTLTIYTANDSKWLLLNYEAAAYCRVNYDERNWRMLQTQLRSDFTRIHVKSRSQLVDDSLQLARAGYLPYNIALDTTTYLINETAMFPWQSAIANFEYLEDMLASRPGYAAYKAYIIALTKNLYDRYGFDDSAEPADDISSHYLRQMAVWAQCRSGSASCIQMATFWYRLFLNACLHQTTGSSECSIVYPGLRSTIYCIGAQEDGTNSSNWDLLWNLYAREQVAMEKAQLMRGMSCTQNMTLVQKLLAEAMNPNSTAIRRQDVSSVFYNLARNRAARSLLWPYFEQNWPTIKKLFSKFALREIINSATYAINTEEQLNNIQRWYDLHSAELGSGKRAFQQQLERARTNKQWIDNYEKTVTDWLNGRREGEQVLAVRSHLRQV